MMLSWLAAVLHCRRRNDTVDGVSFLFYPKNNASGGGVGIFCPRIFQVYIYIYTYINTCTKSDKLSLQALDPLLRLMKLET